MSRWVESRISNEEAASVVDGASAFRLLCEKSKGGGRYKPNPEREITDWTLTNHNGEWSLSVSFKVNQVTEVAVRNGQIVDVRR